MRRSESWCCRSIPFPRVVVDPTLSGQSDKIGQTVTPWACVPWADGRFDRKSPGPDPAEGAGSGAVPATVDGGVEARRRLRELPRPQFHDDLRVQGYDHRRPRGPIPIRVYWPDNEADIHPVTMYFHGGGSRSATSTPMTAPVASTRWAHTVVVSVDYRLAPEHPYPAAVEDVWAATCWVADHAEEFGADGSRLAVAGTPPAARWRRWSPNGPVTGLRAGRGPAVVFQLPGIRPRWDTSPPSFRENAQAPVLDHAAIAAFTLVRRSPGPQRPPAGLPCRAADLAGLAPAYVAIAGHDPLRDDGARYAELLSQAGVQVELDNAVTLVHGYLGYGSRPGGHRGRRPGLRGAADGAAFGPLISNICRPGNDKPTMTVRVV